MAGPAEQGALWLSLRAGGARPRHHTGNAGCCLPSRDAKEASS